MLANPLPVEKADIGRYPPVATKSPTLPFDEKHHRHAISMHAITCTRSQGRLRKLSAASGCCKRAA